MLYDWYTLDCSTTTLPQSDCVSGQYVYQAVQNDLTTLAANGINLIHLYLWDQDLALSTKPNLSSSESSTCQFPALPGQHALCVHTLPQAESVTGTAVSAFVSSASVPQFPLPVVYSDGKIRDYGTVVPINIPMSVTVSSRTVALAGSSGSAFGTSPTPFQVLPADIEVTGAPLSPTTRMFPPPDAKIIHVYATGLK